MVKGVGITGIWIPWTKIKIPKWYCTFTRYAQSFIKSYKISLQLTRTATLAHPLTQACNQHKRFTQKDSG
jgi:hypothetical protein